MKRRTSFADQVTTVARATTAAPSVTPVSAKARRTRVIRHPERHEQKSIIGLLTGIGAKVYVLGTTRKKGDHQGTMQTPGLPDLIAFLQRRPAGGHQPIRHLLFIECKRPKKGRYSSEQLELRDLCRDAEVSWVGGSLDAVIAWLIEHRYVNPNNIPHYRLPKNLQEGPRA